MRWALAGAGLALEAASLAACLLPPLARRINRAALMPAWAFGALALSVFAILDHDITLLIGQALASALFICLVRMREDGHA